MYEIFELLIGYDLYNIFFNLNQRFRNLCNHPNLLIRFDVPFISKSKFQNYYEHFINDNKYRIESLCISDPFTIEYFSSSTQDISTCSQLRTLIVDTPCLRTLLVDLNSLSKLSSLTITIGGELKRPFVYQQIF